jgi:chromosome segregation ATPase
MNVVKMRVPALALKVQMNKQFRNLQANLGANHREPLGNVGEANGPLSDSSMEDSKPQSSPSPAERMSAEIGQSRTVTDILNRRLQQIALDFQSRSCRNQNSQKDRSQNADDKRQGYCAQTQEPRRPYEMLQGQPDTRTADTTSESQRRGNAQSETEALRKTIQELEAEKVTLLAEVERLGHEICALKADNEKLKADCERPNVGLAVELQDILDLISDRESDVQLLNMANITVPAEAGDFTYLAGYKRGSLEEEGESSHSAVKRLKQEEVVDYAGLASQSQ